MIGWACESAGARVERLRAAIVLLAAAVVAAVAGKCRHGAPATSDCIECAVEL